MVVLNRMFHQRGSILQSCHFHLRQTNCSNKLNVAWRGEKLYFGPFLLCLLGPSFYFFAFGHAHKWRNIKRPLISKNVDMGQAFALLF